MKKFGLVYGVAGFIVGLWLILGACSPAESAEGARFRALGELTEVSGFSLVVVSGTGDNLQKTEETGVLLVVGGVEYACDRGIEEKCLGLHPGNRVVLEGIRYLNDDLLFERVATNVRYER